MKNNTSAFGKKDMFIKSVIQFVLGLNADRS